MLNVQPHGGRSSGSGTCRSGAGAELERVRSTPAGDQRNHLPLTSRLCAPQRVHHSTVGASERAFEWLQLPYMFAIVAVFSERCKMRDEYLAALELVRARSSPDSKYATDSQILAAALLVAANESKRSNSDTHNALALLTLEIRGGLDHLAQAISERRTTG